MATISHRNTAWGGGVARSGPLEMCAKARELLPLGRQNPYEFVLPRRMVISNTQVCMVPGHYKRSSSSSSSSSTGHYKQ